MPVAGGSAFEATGPYECLAGRARFSVDPNTPQDPRIVDLDKAPRNTEGRVDFAADLYILKPIDLAQCH